MDGRTDGRRTLTHDKSSHGLWPGELKTDTFIDTSIEKQTQVLKNQIVDQMKSKEYHSVRKVKKSNRKIIGTEEKTIPQNRLCLYYVAFI